MANWHNFVLGCMNFIVLCLDLVVDISHCYNSVLFNDPIFVDKDFLNLSDNLLLFDYFFSHSWNLNYLLLHGDSMNYFIDEFVNYFVACYENWFFRCYFDKFGNFHCLLNYLLHLVNFRHLVCHLNYLIMIDWNLDELLFNCFCDHWPVLENLDLNNLL